MSFSKPSPLTGFAVLAMTNSGEAFPFRKVLGDLHRLLEARQVVYVVVGGVAVARAGAFRTTGDIDILVRRDGWDHLRDLESNAFQIGSDWALHRETDVPVDVLFAGDDWDLPFLLPDPEGCREWDESAGAWFMTPVRLLELKAATYLAKQAEFGPATAAKDLSDVTSLLDAHKRLKKPEVVEALHPSVQETVRQAIAEVERYRQKRPRSR